MSNHPTRLHQRLDATDEVELITHDHAVAHKAEQARINRKHVNFVFWNGEAEEIVEGMVTFFRNEDPVRFAVRRGNPPAIPAAMPQ